MKIDSETFFSPFFRMFLNDLEDARRVRLELRNLHDFSDTMVDDDYSFNASVELDEGGRPYYRFNKGVCLAITDASITLACNAAFFPEVPVFDLDVGRLWTYNSADRFVDYHKFFPACNEEDLIPWNILRGHGDLDETPRGSHLLNRLVGFATQFIALHEEAHFLLGHLYYFRDLSGLSHMREVGAVSKRAATNIERRLLEISADEFAAHEILQMPKRAKEVNYRNVLDSGIYAEIVRDVERWARVSFAAMAIVTAALERADRYAHADPASECTLRLVRDSWTFSTP